MIIALKLIGGLVLLFLGGEILIRAAVSLARRFGVSPLIIGATVIAAGTSAPELVVGLIAAFEDKPGIAIGNVVGSNIANLLLVLGAAAVIYPIAQNRRALYRDGSVCVGASILFVILALAGRLELWHGVVMLGVLAGYLAGSYWLDRRDSHVAQEIVAEVAELADAAQSLPLNSVKLVAGFAGLIVGSDLLVDGAVATASAIGMSETVIGITIVAVGTSLPELAASVVAARHKHSDVALGNAIGSCIFNLLAIIGAVTLVRPLRVPQQIIEFDMWAMLSVTMLVMIAAFWRNNLGRLAGGVMLTVYALYVALQFLGPAWVPASAT